MIAFGRRTGTPPDIGRLRQSRTTRSERGNHQCWSIDDHKGRRLEDRVAVETGEVVWLTGGEAAPAGDGWYVVGAEPDGTAIAAIGPFKDDPQEVMDALMALHATAGSDQEKLCERLTPQVDTAIDRRVDATAQELANAWASPRQGAQARRTARNGVIAAGAAAERWRLANTD